MRTRQLFVIGVVMVLALAACGQKPGIHIAGANNGFAGGGDNTGTGTGDNGTGNAGGGTGTGNTVGSGSGTTGGTTDGGATGGGTVASGPGDRTGITPTTITIGIHAPTSGAAPIKAESFQVGKDLYWNWLKHQGKKTIGRDVKVLFRDDHYDPQTAATVCSDMAESGKAFLLIGAAGADQINVCSRYSNARGIPYLSAGVTEIGTGTRQTYFALTMSYPKQQFLLAQYIKKLGGGEDRISDMNGLGNAGSDGRIKIAFVRPDTPNFNDAEDALSTAIKQLGGKYQVKPFTISKDENPQDAPGIAQRIKQYGADIISVITAPVFTLSLSKATVGQQYRPRYMGVGITNAINQAIPQECDNNQFSDPPAMFFSPWPGWSQRNTYDPEFEQAVNLPSSDRGYTPRAKQLDQRNKGGDLLLALWGIMKDVHEMFEFAGANMSRQSFVQQTQSFSTHGSSHFFPNLQFTSGNRFGASEVHALVGRCDSQGGEFIEDPQNAGLRSKF
ncbi:MAG: ABC transporter substrate-binding protein [Actinomycetota bacterium]|nr:ABC transporter substrate-binding protein [Actinomycetota bacterium]